MSGDPCAGNSLEILPGEFERRHDPDIGSPARQTIRANRRYGEFKIEQIPLRPVQHSPNEGSSV